MNTNMIGKLYREICYDCTQKKNVFEYYYILSIDEKVRYFCYVPDFLNKYPHKGQIDSSYNKIGFLDNKELVTDIFVEED